MCTYVLTALLKTRHRSVNYHKKENIFQVRAQSNMTTQKPHKPPLGDATFPSKGNRCLRAKTMNRVGNTHSTVTGYVTRFTPVRSEHGTCAVSLADVRTAWYFIAQIFTYV